MAEASKHVPIFYMDVQGFTTHNLPTQRTIIERLQHIAREAARFFMPYGEPWARWQRHGTGDGYYFVFDGGLSPQIAMHYAVTFDEMLAAHNTQHGQDLTIRLYGVLVLGDVELVRDQYLSQAFSEAARFLSYQPLKDHLQHQERPMVLAMSALFHTEWQADIARKNLFPETASLQWSRFTCRDKHDDTYQGYVRGAGWETPGAPRQTQAELHRHYYQNCSERWSQERYALDKRFVRLTLLLDQGEDAQGQRWRSATCQDLQEVLAQRPEPAIVVLGSPGAGKSTLLQHFELDNAQHVLRTTAAEALPQAPLTFFLPLNLYRPEHGTTLLPAPLAWLRSHWAARCPDFPDLETLLRTRQVTLLLDALNEIPVAGPEPVLLWKAFVRDLPQNFPNVRVIFSCRSLDYSASLSSNECPVPQVRIEALADEQVQEFLLAYCPEHGAALWQKLRGTAQLEVLRLPYYLKLLVAQTNGGDIPLGRAALFSGFVRHALLREVKGDHPLFRPDTLLHARDVQRLIQARDWPAPFTLPERGVLIPRLSALAFAMQRRQTALEGTQVRIPYDEARALLEHPQAGDILQAAEALGVLDEHLGRDEVMFRHQLLQEYFAARHLARQPQPELVHQAWQVEHVVPGLQETLQSLADADPLPPLPGTGWEETMVLAVAMAEDPASLVTALMAHNLPLAGRCAAQPEGSIPARLQEEIRRALVQRTQDARADLRARIAAGLALGHLGDPRWMLQRGPYGEYLLPPMIEIPGGAYVLGSDEGFNNNEAPVHEVTVASFALGQFPVTNAEWVLFMRAGGYEDERWWETEAARAWRRGEKTEEGPRQERRETRKYCQDHPTWLSDLYQQGRITSQALENWERYARMSDEDFEVMIAGWHPEGRQTQPAFWHDDTLNNPAQPVVGICWFEACAYCAWLSAQTGQSFRLPSEAEWEVAARGPQRHRYAYGNDFNAAFCNAFETHIRRTTPVGVFPGGETPQGIVDMTGNVWEWTSTIYQPYPYDGLDGRENPISSVARRVLRGGSWDFYQDFARAAFRNYVVPGYRDLNSGLRVARSSPIPLLSSVR